MTAVRRQRVDIDTSSSSSSSWPASNTSHANDMSSPSSLLISPRCSVPAPPSYESGIACHMPDDLAWNIISFLPFEVTTRGSFLLPSASLLHASKRWRQLIRYAPIHLCINTRHGGTADVAWTMRCMNMLKWFRGVTALSFNGGTHTSHESVVFTILFSSVHLPIESLGLNAFLPSVHHPLAICCVH